MGAGLKVLQIAFPHSHTWLILRTYLLLVKISKQEKIEKRKYKHTEKNTKNLTVHILTACRSMEHERYFERKKKYFEKKNNRILVK